MKLVKATIVLALTACATQGSALPQAETGPAIVDIDATSLNSAKTFPVTDQAYMILTEGRGGSVGSVDLFKSTDGRFAAGLASFDKISLQLRDWPVDEFMHIIEGQVEIKDLAGHGRVYGPGDSFIMPKGFNGTWRQLGPIRKIVINYKVD